jgi:hypothetical protein
MHVTDHEIDLSIIVMTTLSIICCAIRFVLSHIRTHIHTYTQTHTHTDTHTHTHVHTHTHTHIHTHTRTRQDGAGCVADVKQLVFNDEVRSLSSLSICWVRPICSCLLLLSEINVYHDLPGTLSILAFDVLMLVTCRLPIPVTLCAPFSCLLRVFCLIAFAVITLCTYLPWMCQF